MRPHLSAAQLLAIAGISMSPANPLPVTQRERLQPDPPRAFFPARRRNRSPGWHDPAKLDAAEAKRARKGQHLRHCAERGGFGARPFVGA